jgi:hypothetical protein
MMKNKLNILCFVLLNFITVKANAQVGIGTSTPHVSAELDVTSTTKGFLPPRMTAAQRDAIVTPAAGLIVWCTNCGINGEAQVYNGTTFTNMIGDEASLVIGQLVIGQIYQGGILAYIFVSGDPGYVDGQIHGLIAAPTNQSESAEWGCQGTAISGADGSVLGTGSQNTIDIMAGCATADIAARLCGDLVVGVYSDWYLPSLDELDKLYLNGVAIGMTLNSMYWSSTDVEYSDDHAMRESLGDGNQGIGGKSEVFAVRAIRSF